MQVVVIVLTYVLWIYLLLLIGRLIMDFLTAPGRSWTPKGIMIKVAEVVYTATDPPLRFLRRYLRPVRLGSVALDLSYTLLFLVIIVLLSVVSRF